MCTARQRAGAVTRVWPSRRSYPSVAQRCRQSVSVPSDVSRVQRCRRGQRYIEPIRDTRHDKRM
eukprot:1933052-Prymnesium_polylepis.3